MAWLSMDWLGPVRTGRTQVLAVSCSRCGPSAAQVHEDCPWRHKQLVFVHTPPLYMRRLLTFQVIRPENCSLCGKRIRFGKMAVKCRNCRMVTHLECQKLVVISCPDSSLPGSTQQVPLELLLIFTVRDLWTHLISRGLLSSQISLERFAPVGHPRIPMLMVECIAEIERRGLNEVTPPPPMEINNNTSWNGTEQGRIHRNTVFCSFRKVCTGFLGENV